MRGRIDVALSDHYKEMALPGLIANYNNLFNEMMYVNKAHTVMLYNRKVLDQDTIKNILNAINSVHNEFKAEDLALENGDDLYLNVEHQMIDRVGHDAGKMHTGRSRNDLYSTLSRMVCRRELIKVLNSIVELQEILIEMAKNNLDSVMTGYTHLQPAQPTTLAHYLTSYLNVLARDFTRLKNTYACTNINPLGAAAFAGTGFPIDREMTTKLLGFDAVLENTWDGVASRDYYMQADADLAILQNTLTRVAQDLYTWVSDEFAVWELGGQVSGQSSIMPQKKNPSTLENVRMLGGGAFGSFSATFMAFKNTPFSFICDSFRMDGDFLEAVKSTLSAIEYMKETLKYSTLYKERALAMAEKNFCTVTALADHLVGKFNIAFRDAHHIIGGMVSDAKKAGLDVNGMDSVSLKKWSKQILGEELDLSDEEIHKNLAPIPNVESKKCIGGPSKERCSEMINHLEEIIKNEKSFVEEVSNKIQDAYSNLDNEVNKILGK